MQRVQPNSFVIETYVKNLLESARYSLAQAIELCIEALGILFSALTTNEVVYRKSQLGILADQALALLFQQTPELTQDVEPVNALDMLIKAWKTLTEGGTACAGFALTDVPAENRERALGVLTHPVGHGNMLVIRLRFDLTCLNHPYAFKQQMDFVEQLYATDYRMTPQLRLEYAILLFQNERAVEGEKQFRSLRQLWRDSEHFVHVPERLRWLRTPDGENLKTVSAIASSDNAGPPMAKVKEFGNALVPFRPEEHSFRELKPGLRFACHVSFGHKGPFLRPVTINAPRIV